MSIKSLPPMEKTFTINVKGVETAQQFDGTFTYRRPNLKTKAEISKTIARLGEDLNSLDEDTKLLHKILATLRHCLIKTPDWWTKADYGYELYDINVVFEIYSACSEFENEWFSKVWTEEEPKEDKKEPVELAKS